MNPFIGEIKIFSGSFAPIGWAFCDGTHLPINGNETLYTLLGTTYGGDGVQTFGLPDLRGRVPLGVGLTNLLGQPIGTESVTLAAGNLPAHSHSMLCSSKAGTVASPKGNYPAGNSGSGADADTTYHNAASGGATMLGSMVQPNTGGGLPHNNMQPFGVITYIIATAGIYPAQG